MGFRAHKNIPPSQSLYEAKAEDMVPEISGENKTNSANKQIVLIIENLY